MTIGVVLAVTGAENYVDEIVRLTRDAAAAGIQSAWFGQRLDYDSAALAGIAGREMPGLQVGTSAVPVFGRHPILVWSQAQTAPAATHGRYHLGLALGARSIVESTFGLAFERPIARLREFLTALRPLLETGKADFHGELLTAAPTCPSACRARRHRFRCSSPRWGRRRSASPANWPTARCRTW